jgi:DNA primase
MAIVEEDVERVKAATSIVDLVQKYVALRRVGRNFVGLCPFHSEKSGSFNVSEERGRYYCFGCQASGDVFKFVQDIEHVDFVGAVETLAGNAGIQLNYTSGGEGRDRQRRRKLIETMEAAVEWYHERLLTDGSARPAREYLRSRGLTGDVAREFRLGWAPDDWDSLSRKIGAPDLLKDTGLAFVNRGGRLQDAFRGRIMFPIFTDVGDPVAFGGRILPGSSDPAKYKNSAETPIYAKSKTLYGLNWAKADIVANDQVIVCEGYTDVIGFHRAGLRRAVATCGTAFTEEHVRLITRFAKRVVLAFDADGAGQGAADKFYEWEQRYQVQVAVARFPDGKDPGDLAGQPALLAQAVKDAMPYTEFRLERAMAGQPLRSPEDRARLAKTAMAIVNEHPDLNVRKLYAAKVASQVGINAADLVAAAERGGAPVIRDVTSVRRISPSNNAEFIAVVLLLQRWDEIAPWLVEDLFNDDLHRRAFLALAETNGDLDAALEHADPEAREVLERAAVSDVDADPAVEARNLIGAAVRRALSTTMKETDPDRIRSDALARTKLHGMFGEPGGDDTAGAEAAGWLLGWLDARNEVPG